MDDDSAKLDAIVGAALKGLAESGADDAFVGAFAVRHRERVAQIMGQPLQASPSVDLGALITQAVGMALAAAGVGAAPAKSARVIVWVQGRRTSVTLHMPLLERLVTVKGDKASARDYVRELAGRAPTGVKNRSAWVEARVEAFLRHGHSAPSDGVATH